MTLMRHLAMCSLGTLRYSSVIFRQISVDYEFFRIKRQGAIPTEEIPIMTWSYRWDKASWSCNRGNVLKSDKRSGPSTLSNLFPGRIVLSVLWAQNWTWPANVERVHQKCRSINILWSRAETWVVLSQSDGITTPLFLNFSRCIRKRKFKSTPGPIGHLGNSQWRYSIE